MFCRMEVRVIGFMSVLYLTSLVKADIFSSTAHLQNLLHLERHLVTTLHDYVEKTESKLSQVKRYLNLFYDSYQDVLEEKVPVSGEEDMVGNPIQAFQLIRRLAVDWGFVRNAMITNDWHPIQKLTHDYKQLMPNQDDLQGAALALVRLQETYKLNMSDVARGKILGLEQGTTLTARDVLYLGKESFNSGYYAHAVQWLEEALRKAQLEGNKTASVSEIMAFYTSAVDMNAWVNQQCPKENAWFNRTCPKESASMHQQCEEEHDNLFERTDINVDDYDTFGHPLKGPLRLSRAAISAGKRKIKLGPNINPHEEQANYMALCRGEHLMSVIEESKLLCRLEHRGIPYFFLQPLRIEERGLKPYIIQIHNLITEHQVDLLKEIAEPKLARSRVQSIQGSEIVSLARTSQNAWVGPNDHPLMKKIYDLVGTVTGLSTNVDSRHAEIVQIANYGMGGHYTPHYDYLLVDKTPEELIYVSDYEKEAGDRTATIMFYLSDVSRGGATVFPKVGASVWPSKGSAVLWYNLKRNGREEPLTLHGACPVAVGSKWIANFWIREKGQTFRRPCALDADL